MAEHRIYSMAFASVYPAYVNKVEKKGRTKDELDQVIRWLTGYSQEQLNEQLDRKVDCETFIGEADLNPSRDLIKGVVCGVRVEEVKEPVMRELRCMDKLVDELAKGKPMEKILRSA